MALLTAYPARGGTIRGLLLLAVLALTSGNWAFGVEPPAEDGGWRMRTFMISHWSFPKDEARLKLFAQAGFNTVIATPQELPACRRHGWQALLAIEAEKAGDYVRDPIIWGYFVFDEPALKKVGYETFAGRMEALHKLDPTRPAYINLNEKDDPEKFIKLLAPRVLSYDYYPWWATPEPFFPLLEKFRRAALSANIPLICWVEAVAAAHGPAPADNEAKLRHSVYSALAYGAKGIQWWAWRPDNQDAAKINAELKVLGPTLMQLRSVDVFHTAPLPPQTRALPADLWVQSPTESLLLGLFKDAVGNDFILAANRNWKAATQATLTFSGAVSAVSMLDRKTGNWVDLQLTSKGNQKTIPLQLAPGDGVLLRITRNK